MRRKGNSHRWKMRVLAAFAVAIAMLCLPFAKVAMADTVVDHDQKGSIHIVYLDVDGKAVGGAKFTARLVAEPLWNGAFRSLVPIDIDANTNPVDVAEMAAGIEPLRAETDIYGLADFKDLEHGLYLVQEETPAPGYFASIPFFAAIPFMKDGEWAYDLEAMPKPLSSGSLRVSKTVSGANGEHDRKFRFQLAFGDKDSHPIVYSTGEEGTVSNGAVIALKDGESATISMLVPGTAYKVTELEANQDGYATMENGTEGTIRDKETMQAAFLNIRGGATPTPGGPCGTCTPIPPCTTCTPIPPCTTCTPGPGTPPNVQTGDSMAMPIAFGVGFISLAAGIVVLLFARGRKERHEEH